MRSKIITSILFSIRSSDLSLPIPHFYSKFATIHECKICLPDHTHTKKNHLRDRLSDTNINILLFNISQGFFD